MHVDLVIFVPLLKPQAVGTKYLQILTALFVVLLICVKIELHCEVFIHKSNFLIRIYLLYIKAPSWPLHV